jgi:ribosomal subunit interface protein
MQIQWVHFPPHRSAHQRAVESQIRKLTELDGDLLNVHIVAQPSQHHRQGGQTVKLTCIVRGATMVSLHECADLDEALKEAVRDLECQVRKRHERRYTHDAADRP